MYFETPDLSVKQDTSEVLPSYEYDISPLSEISYVSSHGASYYDSIDLKVLIYFFVFSLIAGSCS